MKMEITEQKSNPIMKRVEVHFAVDHVGETTPGRNAAAEEIAKKMKSKRACVVIDTMDSLYGIGKTKGYAKVYESKEAAQEFESAHLLKRNGLEKEAYVKPPKE